MERASKAGQAKRAADIGRLISDLESCFIGDTVRGNYHGVPFVGVVASGGIGLGIKLAAPIEIHGRTEDDSVFIFHGVEMRESDVRLVALAAEAA